MATRRKKKSDLALASGLGKKGAKKTGFRAVVAKGKQRSAKKRVARTVRGLKTLKSKSR